MVLLVLCTWGDDFREHSVDLFGDNVAALDLALTLRGRGALTAIARELSWRQARRQWRYRVAHLPAEHNLIADSLSRVADPKGVAYPSAALGAASFRAPPKLKDLWLARPK